MALTQQFGPHPSKMGQPKLNINQMGSCAINFSSSLKNTMSCAGYAQGERCQVLPKRGNANHSKTSIISEELRPKSGDLNINGTTCEMASFNKWCGSNWLNFTALRDKCRVCVTCVLNSLKYVKYDWRGIRFQDNLFGSFYLVSCLLLAILLICPKSTSATTTSLVSAYHVTSPSTAPELTTQQSSDKGDSSTESMLVEGDIMLSPWDKEDLLTSMRTRKKRKTVADKTRLWPLPIPYRFSNKPENYINASERQVVVSAMRELSTLTCITFREVDSTYNRKPVLDFMKGYGCWSHVGREQAYPFQEVSVAESCFVRGIILHELGHVIGFWHEQSRPDRDQFVTFMENNVNRRESYNFRMETWGEIDNLGVPYDVGSIMHYGSTSYSKNGRVTLRSKDPLLQRSMGQRERMSFYDIKAANLAYCKNECSTVTFSCLHDGYPDPKDCSRCRCPDGLHGTRCQAAAPAVGATCGGPLFVDKGARYTIKTPGFPTFYSANVQCNWLFQAEPGMRLHLKVESESFMRHPKCLTSDVSVCENDYVEIKYNMSFGNTGARFCCGIPPTSVIVSSGNTMLVLFRTSRLGVGGVKAEIYAEPCGGCFPSHHPQVPCKELKTFSCVQKWVKQEYVACPVYFRVLTSACNKYVNRRHSRTSVCHQEKPSCCVGAQLKDGMCHATDKVKIPDSGDDSTTGDSSGPDTIKPEVTSDPLTGWLSWAPWSSCTASCGGCGRRARVRNCAKISMCGGKLEDREIQVCNYQPCPKYQAYTCQKETIQEYHCGWLQNCTRVVTEVVQCVTRCCPHYQEDHRRICQPVKKTSSSARRKRRRRRRSRHR